MDWAAIWVWIRRGLLTRSALRSLRCWRQGHAWVAMLSDPPRVMCMRCSKVRYMADDGSLHGSLRAASGGPATRGGVKMRDAGGGMGGELRNTRKARKGGA